MANSETGRGGAATEANSTQEQAANQTPSETTTPGTPAASTQETNTDNSQTDQDKEEQAEQKPGFFSRFRRERNTLPQYQRPKSYAGRNTEAPTLSREKNGVRANEIERLVEDIGSFQFEMNMRSERFREISGQNWIGRRRAFLGGDGMWVPEIRDGNVVGLNNVGGDFEYIREIDEQGEESGEGHIRHRWQRETWRKTKNVLFRTARTAAIGIATGLVVGTVAAGTLSIALPATFASALIGSAAARGIYEGVRSSGKERRIKGQLEAARIRYFQKSRELARVVSETTHQESESEEDFNERRNGAIENLVNFVYSYENLSVITEHEQEGNERIGVGGVELIQPGEDSPDAVTIGSLEQELANVKGEWDKWEERIAALGGIAGSAYSLLQGGERWIADIFEGYRDRLMNGEGVKLHMEDNIFRGHVVQKVTDATNNLQENFVYHLRGLHEQFGAQEAGGHIMNLANNADVGDVGRFGSHVLEGGKAGVDQFGNFSGELGKHLNYALWQKSCLEAIGKVGHTAVMLGSSYLLGRHAARGNENNEANYRKRTRDNHNQFLKRFHPETPDQPNQQDAQLTTTEDGNTGTTGTGNDPRTPDDGTTSPETEPTTDQNPEINELRDDNYDTIARRERFNKAETRERAACFGVRNHQQMLISLRKNESNDQNYAKLGKIAERLRLAYDSLSNNEVASMEDALSNISSKVARDDEALGNCSWSIVITTPEGQFFGYRWNNDESQLFTVDNSGRIEIPSRDTKIQSTEDNKQSSNKKFVTGYVENGSLIALLDSALSESRKDDQGVEGIYVGDRAKILREKIDLKEKVSKLIQARRSKDSNVSTANEISAILSQIKKRETVSDIEKRERERKIGEKNSVSLKHKDETFTEIEIKDNTVLAENYDGDRIYWQAKLNSNKTEITLVPCGFDTATNTLKPYEGVVDQKTFSMLFDLQEWILNRYMEEAPEVEEALKKSQNPAEAL